MQQKSEDIRTCLCPEIQGTGKYGAEKCFILIMFVDLCNIALCSVVSNNTDSKHS